MYYEIYISLIVFVKLDEVIAAAECSYRLIKASGILEFTVAIKIRDKLLRLTLDFHLLADKRFESELILAYNFPRRHIAAYILVESMVVNICQFAEIEDTHTAADVNAHDI